MKPESLALLQDLRSLASKTIPLAPSDEDLIKSTFKKILESGDTYNVADLENWFLTNAVLAEGSVFDRMLNIAHYQKSKFEASNKFRIVSEGNECSCGGNH
ncbi:MAG TPA: hypothetical protein VJ792_01360 [Candidatus Nitrosotalea sp.]|nr:hypothetical protein [Candidatus Nitrosotalea sp.]